MCTRSTVIDGFWNGENAVWLNMGLDVSQSTRLDRFAGSRILSMANNDALDSTTLVQTVKLVELLSHETAALTSMLHTNDVQQY